MEAPIWVEVLGAASTVGVALLTVLLTRERSGGQDHARLVQCTADVAALKMTVVSQATTLATHTTLHEHTEKDIDDAVRRIRIVEEKQDLALGREQGRKHEGRQ